MDGEPGTPGNGEPESGVGGESAADTPDARVRRAIDDAEVGADDLFAGLADLDGIGEIAVERGTARVTVTLPVPASAIRGRIEDGIRAAAVEVGGIDAVEVDWDPAAADPGERVDVVPEVRNVVAVASGKGGVGKSTVAANLAAALADAGAAVGLLDADIYGPNAPALLGIDDATPRATRGDRIVPREAAGVSVMSMDFVVGEDDPVIWRGPIVDDALKQLLGDVAWGSLDYLIVDLPPGTGDAQLSLVQHLPLAGVVVVTTPQPVAVDDARRGLRGFARYDVPVLGIAENMSGLECPDCGGVHRVFGDGGGEALAGEFDVPLLGRIPLDPSVGTVVDDGHGGASPGVSIPLVGRVGLPRTREEREGRARLPPAAVREDGGEVRAVFRAVASRAAARVNAAATLDR